MGSFTPSLVVPRVAVCEPRSCSRIARPVCMLRGQMRPQKCADVFRQDRFAHEPRFSRRTHAASLARSNRTTIASMMLAPCSASSMLSASLRPGQWPGLRALTTPARGTVWQLRDGGERDDGFTTILTRTSTRAYGGLITSVPHGTPPVSPQRHPERAFRRPPQRARLGAHPSQHRSLLRDHRQRLICTP